MLLFDIEKHVEPLSNVEKKQLIRDIQQMLKEDISTIEGWKFHLDYNLTEMYETAKNLQAFAATLPGPKYLFRFNNALMTPTDLNINNTGNILSS